MPKNISIKLIILCMAFLSLISLPNAAKADLVIPVVPNELGSFIIMDDKEVGVRFSLLLDSLEGEKCLVFNNSGCQSVHLQVNWEPKNTPVFFKLIRDHSKTYGFFSLKFSNEKSEYACMSYFELESEISNSLPVLRSSLNQAFVGWANNCQYLNPALKTRSWDGWFSAQPSFLFPLSLISITESKFFIANNSEKELWPNSFRPEGLDQDILDMITAICGSKRRLSLDEDGRIIWQSQDKPESQQRNFDINPCVRRQIITLPGY